MLMAARMSESQRLIGQTPSRHESFKHNSASGPAGSRCVNESRSGD